MIRIYQTPPAGYKQIPPAGPRNRNFEGRKNTIRFGALQADSGVRAWILPSGTHGFGSLDIRKRQSGTKGGELVVGA